MKIFLSWSGDQSKAIAEALRDWLPKVIQSVKPWMSARDIERGARWSSDIAAELQDTQFGIICLTSTNLGAPWIHFEAGALSKSVDQSRVCPYLFKLEPSALVGPLVQFNAAVCNKEDTLKLITSINNALEEPLSSDGLSETFEMWWERLEQTLNAIPPDANQVLVERPERDILQELLDLSREHNKQLNSIVYESPSADVLPVKHSVRLRSTPAVKRGSYVRHEKFGRGLVLDRADNGKYAKITVDFPEVGQKRFVEAFANLVPED